MKQAQWIGVDLDGTLAKYEGWAGFHHIGEPVPAMVQRVKGWLAEGWEVRIFTARVGKVKDVNDAIRAREAIEKWCIDHIGHVLPITATKDFAMAELWDDRAVQVIPNTGVCYRDISEKAAAFVMAAKNPDADPAELDRLLREFDKVVEAASAAMPEETPVADPET